ncbi:MAG: hypothetical protein MI739_14220 [Bacteroidales bacterium]|nr:hypothetical protein [Bacteroidales bacterium]
MNLKIEKTLKFYCALMVLLAITFSSKAINQTPMQEKQGFVISSSENKKVSEKVLEIESSQKVKEIEIEEKKSNKSQNETISQWMYNLSIDISKSHNEKQINEKEWMKDHCFYIL